MEVASRRAPDATGEDWGVARNDDLAASVAAGGTRPRLIERYSLVDLALVWQRVTALDGVAAVNDYPGTVTATTGSTTTTFKCNANLAFDPTGMLIVVMSGSAGHLRLIKDWNGTDTVSVEAWDSSYTPSSGHTAEILIDCRGKKHLYARCEFEANDSNCVLVPVFYDYPRDPTKGTNPTDGMLGIDTTKRAPIESMGAELAPYAYARTTRRPQQSGYFLSRTVWDGTGGAIGAKVWLMTVPAASKKVTPWLAAA